MRGFIPLMIFLIFLIKSPALAQDISVSPDPLNVGTISTSELNQGYVEITNAATIRITNDEWELLVRASYDVSNWSPKAVSDFMWKLSDSENYTPLSQVYVQITTGTGNKTLYIDYKILVSWEDEPKSYSITLRYRVMESDD